MLNNEDILKLGDVVVIDKNKTIVIGKQAKNLQVYRVPLKYLYYNDQNDRISTEIVRYEAEGHTINREDREEFNKVFEKLIYETDPDRLDKTQKSIKNRGQDNPGVTLKDGRVVDGNRRFTCLRRIQRDTNQEQYFETVILDLDYEHQYKLIKSLELELQMGVEEKVPYDPIDRLFGVYKSIRMEKAFTVDEYAALFDDKTVSDVKKDLELADLMCEFLDYIGCHEQFHIAKDLKLDGVLHEIPRILNNVEETNPNLVDDVKAIIFSAIFEGTSTRMNLYVREQIGKLVKEKGDLEELVNNTRDTVDGIMDVIENNEIRTSEDINDIRADETYKDALNSEITTLVDKVNGRNVQNAPLKSVREANNKLNSIVTASIPSMNDTDKTEMRKLLSKIENKLGELRSAIDS